MKTEESNAKKFLNAYNQIDYALRVQHDFKRSMGFQDMIRRAVAVNYIVRKYEDDLVDFGRLRNAIVHRSNEDYVIAEPHDDVVQKICGISELIATPPKAIDVIEDKKVLTVEYNVVVRDVIELIAKSKYSNLPIYKNGELVGVANGQKILDAMGDFLLTGGKIGDFVETKTIEEIVEPASDEVIYYKVVPASISVEEALNYFYNQRKLLCLILTKNGSTHELPIAIITTHDYMEMNKIMENY